VDDVETSCHADTIDFCLAASRKRQREYQKGENKKSRAQRKAGSVNLILGGGTLPDTAKSPPQASHDRVPGTDEDIYETARDDFNEKERLGRPPFADQRVEGQKEKGQEHSFYFRTKR